MQFSKTIISVIALATAASAAPTGGDGYSSITCDNGNSNYCCNSSFLGLTCILSSLLLSNTCSAQSICCSNAGSGTQTCTNANGVFVTVPIIINVL